MGSAEASDVPICEVGRAIYLQSPGELSPSSWKASAVWVGWGPLKIPPRCSRAPHMPLTSASFPHLSGPSREECIHCAKSFHFQDWKCVPACGEGFYPEEMPGLPHKVCRRYGLPGCGPGLAGSSGHLGIAEGAAGWPGVVSLSPEPRGLTCLVTHSCRCRGQIENHLLRKGCLQLVIAKVASQLAAFKPPLNA